MNLATVLHDLERRRDDASRMQATAPLADVLATVLEDLRAVTEPPQSERAAPAEDRLLTAADVAGRLTCSLRYVYAHADDWPFTRREGKLVRFSANGLARWIASGPR